MTKHTPGPWTVNPYCNDVMQEQWWSTANGWQRDKLRAAAVDGSVVAMTPVILGLPGAPEVDVHTCVRCRGAYKQARRTANGEYEIMEEVCSACEAESTKEKP